MPNTFECELVNFIYNNDIFNLKKILDISYDVKIVSIKVNELDKAKEYFKENEKVLDFIDKCQDYNL